MRVTIWSPYMGKVGTIKVMINLAMGFSKSFEVDLIRVYREWEGYELLIREYRINLIDFRGSKVFPKLPSHGKGFRLSMGILSLFSLPKLVWYLNTRKPDVMVVSLLSFLPFLARKFSAYKPKIILSVQGLVRFSKLRRFLWSNFQSKADRIIFVTEASKMNALRIYPEIEGKAEVICNPILEEGIKEMSRENVDHKWFKDKREPVIIGVGRLTRQKDFGTLIRAFQLVQKEIPSKLVILGEGEERAKLERLIGDLGLEGKVWMPGFVKNPYKYMARSDVFVLSSLWEDLSHVLMEAAYLGVPIVSTNCPNGPEEFLEGGRCGFLCAIGGYVDIAEKIKILLSNGRLRKRFTSLALRNASKYLVERGVEGYIRVISEAMEVD